MYKRQIERQAGLLLYQMVCFDKVNQLRHARFLPDMAAIERHMARHAEILRPKFELVLDALTRELTGCGRDVYKRQGILLAVVILIDYIYDSHIAWL